MNPDNTLNPNPTPAPTPMPTQPQGLNPQPPVPQPMPPTDPGMATGGMPPQQPQSPAQPAERGMFKGRLNRIGFLLMTVYVLAYSLVTMAIAFLLHGNAVGNIVTILLGLVLVVCIIPVGISVNARRLHDMNQSGWVMLVSLIPFVGFIMLLVYLLVPGTKGPNNYGDVDNRPSTPGKVLFGK